MRRGERLAVLVSGMVCGTPRQGGATWAVMQYVLGLRQLGHDVVFVEQLRDEPPNPGVIEYFEDVVAFFGMEGRASLLSAEGVAVAGASRPSVERFASAADLILNLSGTLTDEALLERIPMRVYVDLDPAFTQLWQAVDGVDMGFGRHDRLVTVGLAVGRDGCDVPTCDRPWITTLQPIVLADWTAATEPVEPALTSVGHWRGYGSITHGNTVYGQRAHSMRQLVSIAERSRLPIRLALGIDPREHHDISLLRRSGWQIIDPDDVAATPAEYASFVRNSWAELGVAKSGYVESKSGWFSDRSLCYLASGRPVIAQDTGFSDYLPTGSGLLAFGTPDEALAAIDEVSRDYPRHRASARSLAEDLFDSDQVLSQLIGAL